MQPNGKTAESATAKILRRQTSVAFTVCLEYQAFPVNGEGSVRPDASFSWDTCPPYTQGHSSQRCHGRRGRFANASPESSDRLCPVLPQHRPHTPAFDVRRSPPREDRAGSLLMYDTVLSNPLEWRYRWSSTQIKTTLCPASQHRSAEACGILRGASLVTVRLPVPDALAAVGRESLPKIGLRISARIESRATSSSPASHVAIEVHVTGHPGIVGSHSGAASQRFVAEVRPGPAVRPGWCAAPRRSVPPAGGGSAPLCAADSD